MGITSGFFDAVETSSGVYDRVYDAADFAHYFSLFIGNGVYPDPSTGLQVKASATPNMGVSISAGNGWINGYYITLDAAESRSITTANATLSRIDSVVIGLSYTTRSTTLTRDTNTWELELAQILVTAGAANITQSAITDMRPDNTRCGIVSGVVDQINTTELFAQYTAAFNEWFTGVKEELSTDVAVKLQNQIDTNKSLKLELTLSSSNWSNNEQTLTNSNLIASGYTYVIGPAYASKKNYDKAKIEAKDVTENGKITFVCSKIPTASLTVQVLRVKV